MPRLTNEQREKIRELQEKGISDIKISRMLGVPPSTVYYQRPDVKERRREYMREYSQRPEVKERRREYMREYYKRHDVKERMREYYKRHDVKERMREYMREYYKRPEVKERMRRYPQKKKMRDIQFEELMDLARRVETENNLEGLSLSKNNLYVSILECLNDTKYGKKYKQMVNGMNTEGRKIVPKLKKLRNEGLINYYDKRYSLSDKGKRLCRYLFSEVLLA